MRIAVVGCGIAGMVAAQRLCRSHEVTVFEAGDTYGGHTHTVDVELAGEHYAVDMGFIVYNDKTYPRFSALLAELDVATQPSSMSFSLRCERTGLEYNGTTLNSLFAQRRNLFRPSFLRMIADILRFNREAPAVLHDADGALALGEYIARHRYSQVFKDRYLVPMGISIWSATHAAILECPVRFFVDFFLQHGFLNVNDRPAWRAVRGGSREYAKRLTAPFGRRIRLRTPVAGIARSPDGVTVRTARGELERFDYVFLACHSDQALAMLESPTPQEQEILGAFPYQENEAVLHTDARMLPRIARARAAWNYHALESRESRVAVTYNMSILQTLQSPQPLLVTLNRCADIEPSTVLQKFTCHHPVYTPRAVAMQGHRAQISGQQRTFFCGAYWRYGFHEDAVVSAEWAVEDFHRLTARGMVSSVEGVARAV